MQQQDQEQSADQAAQQADQQEQQAVADADDQQQQQQAAAVPESGIPTYGGTMRRASTIETHDYWDPHRGVFGPTQFMHSMLYNNLIRWKNKEKAEMEADISALPEIPDPTTYVFNINPRAAWHDAYPTEGGRNITAEDIVVNVDRNTAGRRLDRGGRRFLPRSLELAQDRDRRGGRRTHVAHDLGWHRFHLPFGDLPAALRLDGGAGRDSRVGHRVGRLARRSNDTSGRRLRSIHRRELRTD